jgi:hypothetical protein
MEDRNIPLTVQTGFPLRWAATHIDGLVHPVRARHIPAASGNISARILTPTRPTADTQFAQRQLKAGDRITGFHRGA